MTITLRALLLAIACTPAACGGGAGGTAPTPIAQDQFAPSELEADALFVYWIIADRDSNSEHLMRYDKASGAITELTAVEDPLSLVQDESSLYWTEVGSLIDASSIDGQILRISKSGGAVETLVSGIQNPIFMAVNGTSIYWSSVPDILSPDPADYAIWQAPKAGGAPTQLTATTGDAGLALHGSTLYFTDFSAGTINALPTAGGSPSMLASGQDGPVRIEADAAHVYWGNEGSDDLWRVGVAGGTPELISATHPFSQRFTLDGDQIYFFSPEGLSRIAKSGGVYDPLTNSTDPGDDIASGLQRLYWTCNTVDAVYELPKPQ